MPCCWPRDLLHPVFYTVLIICIYEQYVYIYIQHFKNEKIGGRERNSARQLIHPLLPFLHLLYSPLTLLVSLCFLFVHQLLEQLTTLVSALFHSPLSSPNAIYMHIKNALIATHVIIRNHLPVHPDSEAPGPSWIYTLIPIYVHIPVYIQYKYACIFIYRYVCRCVDVSSISLKAIELSTI